MKNKKAVKGARTLLEMWSKRPYRLEEKGTHGFTFHYHDTCVAYTEEYKDTLYVVINSPGQTEDIRFSERLVINCCNSSKCSYIRTF